jgi:hypothetical protein
MAQSILKKAALGILGGVLSGGICLILVYIGGAIAIAIESRDVLATVLAAATVLPLMILLILMLPTIILAVLTGLLAGTVLNFRTSLLSLVGTVAISLILTELVFAVLLPLIAGSESQDFVSFASNKYLAGLYGVILGLLVDRLFNWLASSKTPVENN